MKAAFSDMNDHHIQQPTKKNDFIPSRCSDLQLSVEKNVNCLRSTLLISSVHLNELILPFLIKQSNSKVEKGVKRHITDNDLNAVPPKRGRGESVKEIKTKFSASSNVGNINLLYENVSLIC